MEDYTYHLHPDAHLVLGSHMLEVCESIAEEKPSLEIHPLSIGAKEDPIRPVLMPLPGQAPAQLVAASVGALQLLHGFVDSLLHAESVCSLPWRIVL